MHLRQMTQQPPAPLRFMLNLRLGNSRKVSEKHAVKQATMVACNSTAMNLFHEPEELEKINAKI